MQALWQLQLFVRIVRILCEPREPLGLVDGHQAEELAHQLGMCREEVGEERGRHAQHHSDWRLAVAAAREAREWRWCA